MKKNVKTDFCLTYGVYLQNKTVQLLLTNIKQNMSTIEFYEALIGLEGNLKSFARSFTRNDEDANDLTQETMLRAINYKDYYQPQTNFRAWVYTIMRNTFINQYRRKMNANTIFDNSEDSYLMNQSVSKYQTPDGYIEEKDINQKLDSLENEYRVPFKMYFEGYKYKEIANSLNIPIGTVKSRIFIARKKLIDLLSAYSRN
jgi:RNA polymerase sigma factor (sigma-70 family)